MHNPVELKDGMVFALETYCAGDAGSSAARIEEEVVVTSEGPRVSRLFPQRNSSLPIPTDLGLPEAPSFGASLDEHCGCASLTSWLGRADWNGVLMTCSSESH
jgi:hypothetical protein